MLLLTFFLAVAVGNVGLGYATFTVLRRRGTIAADGGAWLSYFRRRD